MKSINEVLQIINEGQSLVIDSKHFSPSQIIEMIHKNPYHITIKNADKISTTEIVRISQSTTIGKITFDFAE
ncbi:MAG: hypothetical protein AABY93_11725 [Bacteroidota bacterium]